MLSILALSLLLLLLGTGCSRQTEQPASAANTITVSNLTDEASRAELDQVMADAGVSAQRRAVFWDHVDQFNSCEGVTGLTDGYETVDPQAPAYDVYALQDAWAAQHPDFVGYNCRITAYSLMGDYIRVAHPAPSADTNLFLDMEALTADDSAMVGAHDLEGFETLYQTIAGANSKDAEVQAQLVKEAWAEAGITFTDDPGMSLVSVFLHDQFSAEDNELMIGHVGVLFDRGEEGLIFVEKLAFQAPYQAVKFNDRSELKAYLLALYDLNGEDQPTAPAFLFENGDVMQG